MIKLSKTIRKKYNIQKLIEKTIKTIEKMKYSARSAVQIPSIEGSRAPSLRMKHDYAATARQRSSPTDLTIRARLYSLCPGWPRTPRCQAVHTHTLCIQ